jgi:hypothetical protein
MPDRDLTHGAPDRPEDRPAAPPGASSPRDAGRTSGGGSLGHKQPRDVAEQTYIRNQPSDHRRDDPASGDVQR